MGVPFDYSLLYFLGMGGLPLNLEISFRGLPISAQSARVTGARGHAQLWKVDAED